MEPTFVRKPLLAVKSNLLFDLASALNVELEVPMGKRWSVAGEWMFPWWRSNKSDLTMQLLAGHGEIRYWLGDRAKRDVMTGWHLGLYGGGGKFDFQVFNDDGSQGDFFDAGLSLGYAHRIGRSRSLRMEYTLGVGYLRSNYEAYDRVRDTKYGDIKVVRYPWETRRLNWIGPTRARISLVWLLHYRKRRLQNEKHTDYIGSCRRSGALLLLARRPLLCHRRPRHRPYRGRLDSGAADAQRRFGIRVRPQRRGFRRGRATTPGKWTSHCPKAPIVLSC